MKNLTAILFTLLLSFSASAEIRELRYMQHATSDVQRGDVVVFDIDNTILEPVQTIGSDQWFEYMIQNYVKQGMKSKPAFQAALEDWMQVQEITEVQAVEKATPRLIRQLQQKGVTVIALTARNQGMIDTSIKQLKSLNVKFSDYGIGSTRIKDVEFHKGILFVGNNNKGLVLAQFLREQNIEAKRLLFIDDKQKNVKNVDDAFLNSGIVNINYRYGGADNKVASFSAQIADAQWQYFLDTSILLTDEEAYEHITH